MEGWIKLYRQIEEHRIWYDKPFSKGQAWIDILLMVNHKDKTILIGNTPCTVPAGSRITSIHKLAEKWGWSRTKVDNFLKLLEAEKMLIRKSDKKKTLLTVVNWATYQNGEPKKSHEKASKKPLKSLNNNEENEKNERSNVPHEKIIGHLNECAATSFKPTAQITQDKLRARWNEGYELEDFIKVIDHKVKEWKNDPKMSQYLRPETLFSQKFDRYLNEANSASVKTTKKESFY